MKNGGVFELNNNDSFINENEIKKRLHWEKLGSNRHDNIIDMNYDYL